MAETAPRDDLAGLPPILLFDGVCNLCNAAVRFVLNNDRTGRIMFASLQSEVGRALVGPVDVAGTLVDPPGHAVANDPGTFVFVEDGRRYDRSTAALKVARHLGGMWPLLGVFEVVPVGIRDAVYDFVAARRYGWFGRTDACRLPTPEESSRFLEAELPNDPDHASSIK